MLAEYELLHEHKLMVMEAVGHTQRRSGQICAGAASWVGLAPQTLAAAASLQPLGTAADEIIERLAALLLSPLLPNAMPDPFQPATISGRSWPPSHRYSRLVDIKTLMMHQAADNTYPGLERELQEQREPNSGRLAQPMRTPANSPLAGRQKKPGERLDGGHGMPLTCGVLRLLTQSQVMHVRTRLNQELVSSCRSWPTQWGLCHAACLFRAVWRRIHP
jgi:hypothetical protein